MVRWPIVWASVPQWRSYPARAHVPSRPRTGPDRRLSASVGDNRQMPLAPGPLVTAEGRPARDLWALDPQVRHLNHGSFGGVPLAAIEEQRRLLAAMHANPVRWFAELPARVAGARARVSDQLGTDADCLAFVTNASAAFSVLCRSVELPPGGEILLTDHGYGAVAMAAHRWAERIGGRVVVVPVDLAADENDAAAAIVGAFTERTALVVVDQITSPTARRLPIDAICRAARDRGIVSVVDGAHAPMLLPAAQAEGDPDYWFGNLHKFGCAPTGAGVLVPRDGLGDSLFPLIESWGTPLGFPGRFDQQGTSDVTAWLAASTAIGEIEQQLGWGQVRDYVTALADYGQHTIGAAMSSALGHDVRVEVGMPVGPMRLIALPDGLAGNEDDAQVLRNAVLDRLGVACAFTYFRGRGYLRISAHAYNVADDYDDAAERLVPLLASLVRAP